MSPYRAQAKLEASFDEVTDNGATLNVALTDNDGTELLCREMSVATQKGELGRKLRRSRAKFRLNREDMAGHVVLVKLDNFTKYLPLPADTLKRNVRFFAEGGYLIASQMCTVGFKVTDGAGRAVDASGVVVDSRGNEVANVKTIHGGMGSFTFAVQAGEKYRAVVGGESYPLPEVTADAAIIQVDGRHKDFVLAQAVGNVPSGAVLLVHNRGRGIYINKVEAGTSLKFPRSELGEGVVSFMLTDNEGKAMSERLMFNMPSAKFRPTDVS